MADEKVRVCPLCNNTREILRFMRRTIGYTLADGETEANTIDEHWDDCPLCVERGGRSYGRVGIIRPTGEGKCR